MTVHDLANMLSWWDIIVLGQVNCMCSTAIVHCVIYHHSCVSVDVSEATDCPVPNFRLQTSGDHSCYVVHESNHHPGML